MIIKSCWVAIITLETELLMQTKITHYNKLQFKVLTLHNPELFDSHLSSVMTAVK